MLQVAAFCLCQAALTRGCIFIQRLLLLGLPGLVIDGGGSLFVCFPLCTVQHHVSSLRMARFSPTRCMSYMPHLVKLLVSFGNMYYSKLE
jgi:hypothetical protein